MDGFCLITRICSDSTETVSLTKHKMFDKNNQDQYSRDKMVNQNFQVKEAYHELGWSWIEGPVILKMAGNLVKLDHEKFDFKITGKYFGFEGKGLCDYPVQGRFYYLEDPDTYYFDYYTDADAQQIENTQIVFEDKEKTKINAGNYYNCTIKSKFFEYEGGCNSIIFKGPGKIFYSLGESTSIV